MRKILREMFARRFFAAEPRTRKLTIRQDRHKPDFFGAWSMVADKKKQIREITTELELKIVEEDYTLV